MDSPATVNFGKAQSESNLAETDPSRTPPDYVSTRYKRRREDDTGFDFSDFKEEMKTMMKSVMEEQENELKKINPTLKEIQQTNRNIENSIAFLTSQNEEFKNKIEQLESQAKKDREQINLLEGKIEDMQKEDRKSSIEIKGVPKIKDESTEDLIGMVLHLSKSIDCVVTKPDIRDIYRTKGKKDGNKNSPIIVETSSKILKTEILKASKAYNVKHKDDKLCAKHLGIKENENTSIFVSEQLTAKGARLHYLARDLAKSKSYKFCWTSFGRVYVKKNENTSAIPITSEAQVHKLLQGD